MPAWLLRALRRGLSAAPGARWPSMAALLSDLGRDRGRTRRRILAAAAVLALLSVTAVALVRAPRPPVCGGAAAKLAGVWGAGNKAVVRAAFVATGRSDAAATYDRVARRLDGYTDAWTAMREDACQATAVRHEQSEALLDRRMGCLDRRLDELSGLVSVLARRPDPAVLDGAVTMVGRLDPLLACADREALASAVPPPAEPATRAAVASMFERLGRIHALDLAGEDDAGEVRLAEELVRDARTVAYAPVLAEALFALAVEQQGVAKGAAAEATFHQALQAAAAARDDAKVAWIFIYLIRSVGLTQGRPADALALRPLGEAAVIRAGDTPRLRGRLLHSIGTVQREKGQLTEAQTTLEQALVQLEADPERDDQLLGDALNDLAIVVAMRGDSAGATTLFERALERWEAVLGPHHQKIGMGKGNLAEMLHMRGLRREARAAMLGAREIFAAVEGDDGPEVALSDRILGTIDAEEGDYEPAHRELDRALESLLKRFGPDHPQVALALIELADVDVEIGATAIAEERAARAQAIEEKSRGAEHPDVAKALRALARARLASGKPRDALPLVERARSIDEKVTGPAAEGRAADLALRADVMAALGRAQSALDDDALALAIREKNSPDDLLVADSMTAVAERHLGLDRAAAATPLLERALAIQTARLAPRATLARTRFALARALWDGTADRARARTLAGDARDGYESLGPAGVKRKVATDRWLASRR